jgi:hypothetical protein
MTLDEIKACDKLTLTPAEIADVLNCDAQDIRIQARMAPERLGFPVIVVKTRTKIPRVPFLRFMGEQ